MTAVQKSLSIATTEPGNDLLLVTMKICFQDPLQNAQYALNTGLDGSARNAACTWPAGQVAGVCATGKCTFDRAFEEVPDLLSLMGPNGVSRVALSACVGKTAICIYMSPISGGATYQNGFETGTYVTVKALLKGKLA